MPSMPGLPLLAFTRRRAWRIFAAPTTASMRLGVKVPARRQRARLPRTRSEATGEIAPNSVGGNGRDCPELGRRQRARLPRTRSEATGEIAPNSVGRRGRFVPLWGRWQSFTRLFPHEGHLPLRAFGFRPHAASETRSEER